ncbi:hypothetical protein QQF64_005047 [Cirrhinus molitorella]|uniref:Uncharacterized protein n=1 Tax=Cirrhinus molitorella TaxID=172907 RepID=A0ABR3MI10_9TELE
MNESGCVYEWKEVWMWDGTGVSSGFSSSCRGSPKNEEEEGGRAQVRLRPVVVTGMQRWEAAKTIWASVCGAHVEEMGEHADYLKHGERWREHEEQTQTWNGFFWLRECAFTASRAAVPKALQLSLHYTSRGICSKTLAHEEREAPQFNWQAPCNAALFHYTLSQQAVRQISYIIEPTEQQGQARSRASGDAARKNTGRNFVTKRISTQSSGMAILQ